MGGNSKNRKDSKIKKPDMFRPSKTNLTYVVAVSLVSLE